LQNAINKNENQKKFPGATYGGDQPRAPPSVGQSDLLHWSFVFNIHK